MDELGTYRRLADWMDELGICRWLIVDYGLCLDFKLGGEG